MSKNLLLRLVLLVVAATTLSGCTALRERINGTSGADQAETTATYTSVQEVREAQTDQEAVQVTAAEIDAALQETALIEDTEALNSQDIGL